MLREIEFYHGALFARLVRAIDRPLEISEISDSGSSAYLINRRAVLYVKYSTNRLSPWSFTFTVEQLNAMRKLSKAHGVFVLCLVCRHDGIVGLASRDVTLLLGDGKAPTGQLTISVQRRRRELYAVRGSAGDLPHKVSDSTIVRLVEEAIRPRNADQ